MNRLIAASCLLAAAVFAGEYKVGSKVADFNLTDVNGKTVAFNSLKGDTTVLVFVSTKCPVSNAYNERMNALYKDYSPKGVKFVFVNSNFNESAEEVQQHVKSAALDFTPYKDPNNVVADKFGATVTPETFVIGKDGTILYHGHIDDAQNPARIQNQSLRKALDAVLAKQPVSTTETKAFGCTIKRAKKVS